MACHWAGMMVEKRVALILKDSRLALMMVRQISKEFQKAGYLVY